MSRAPAPSTPPGKSPPDSLSILVNRQVAGLKSRSPAQRLRSLDSLTALGPSAAAAAQAIIPILADTALLRPDPADPLPVAGPTTLSDEAVRSLVSIGQAAVPHAIEGLKNRHEAIRAQSARILGLLKAQGVTKSLMGGLKDTSLSVSDNAMEALVTCGEPDALLAGLNERDPEFRKRIVGILGRKKHPSSVDPLLKALRDRDSNVREKAALALGEIGDPRAVSALVSALRDRISFVRSNAAEALGKLRDTTALGPLFEMGDDESDYVREKAAAAIRRISETVQRWRDTRIEALIQRLKNENPPDIETTRDLWLLTGETLGSDYEAWWQWWQKRGRKLR